MLYSRACLEPGKNRVRHPPFQEYKSMMEKQLYLFLAMQEKQRAVL